MLAISLPATKQRLLQAVRQLRKAMVTKHPAWLTALATSYICSSPGYGCISLQRSPTSPPYPHLQQFKAVRSAPNIKIKNCLSWSLCSSLAQCSNRIVYIWSPCRLSSKVSIVHGGFVSLNETIWFHLLQLWNYPRKPANSRKSVLSHHPATVSHLKYSYSFSN